MTRSNEPNLAELFRREREGELRRVPSFERIRAARVIERRTQPARLVWAVMVGAALVAALGVVWRRSILERERTLGLVRVEPGNLRTATDFLLEVSGAEFLRTVPELGQVGGWPSPSRATNRGGRSSRL